jgi:YVTN family beta-propeller protein
MKPRKVLYSLLGCFLLGWALGVMALEPGEEKIYVAVEGEGTLAVFDAASRSRIRTIDLSADQDGIRRPVVPHNVQVAPDGRTVWVTVNSDHGGHESQAGHEDMGHAERENPMDEVVVIDPATDAVIRRIPIASGAHLAHVVLSPDGNTAFVTAQNESAIYTIDARDYRVENKIAAPPASQPHGLRIAPNGSRVYIALLQGKGLGVLNPQTGALETVPLNGAAVQTAVTPDGRMVLVSLYDSKQIAVYDTTSKTLRYIDLFESSRGPVQIYPTPDSRYLYVADQGHYFGQPDSEWVYKVDLAGARAIWSIKAGKAPHGVVLSKDGRFAYVTNLVSDDLSVLDLETDREVARLPVGREPNGVSLWSRRGGGAP